MALELYGEINQGLKAYGMGAAAQRALFARSQRRATIPPASSPLLRQFAALGDLLSAWLEEDPYIDDKGKPRVLKIAGRGATFESLARQFLPDKPLDQVVDLACRCASVGTLSDGRIALYGDPMINFSKLPESALAQTIAHIRQIIRTCLYNVQSSKTAAGSGRLERMVAGPITPENFETFQKALRLELHDVCERVNRLLKGKGPKRGSRGGKAGIGLYVYYDDETAGKPGNRARRPTSRRRSRSR